MNPLFAESMSNYAAVAGGLNVESLTYYMFWIATVCMGAGTVFFLLERTSVPVKYRATLTVSGLITGIACFHYFRMAAIYEGGGFPTEYRYIDWVITTPLMLIKFPLLLQLGGKGKRLLTQLVALDLFMIGTAYVAEVSPVGSGSWWGFFLAACAAELAIVGMLYFRIQDALLDAPQPIARSVRLMRTFIFVGWAIYPIGFLMALSGDGGGALRELFYNCADVINKVGFGLVAYQGIRAIAEVDRSLGLSRDEAAAV